MLKRIRVDLKAANVRGSSVVDADTGVPVSNVRSITIDAGVGRATVVTLELIGVEVEGLVEVEARRT